MKKNNPNGKGDSYRPNPGFADGWERIFGSGVGSRNVSIDSEQPKLQGSRSQDQNTKSKGSSSQDEGA